MVIYNKCFNKRKLISLPISTVILTENEKVKSNLKD